MDHRITILEVEVKELKTKASDLELRLRKVERSVYMTAGALAVLQIILKFAH